MVEALKLKITFNEVTNTNISLMLLEFTRSMYSKTYKPLKLSSSLQAQPCKARSTLLNPKQLPRISCQSSNSFSPSPFFIPTLTPTPPFKCSPARKKSMTFCTRRIVIRTRATGFCVGIESSGCENYAWEYGCEVRCWVGQFRLSCIQEGELVLGMGF